MTSDIFAPSQMSRAEDLTEVGLPMDLENESLITQAGSPRPGPRPHIPAQFPRPSARWLQGETPHIKDLIPIVGSSGKRDIKRSVNFMPGQFPIWNAKATGGRNRYWGGYQDVDHDGLADEYVVRRGNSEGPRVAINGYTTKSSDWPMRSLYYDTYPTREERARLPVSNRMKRGIERIYGPDFQGGLEVQAWRNAPGGEQDDRRAWVEKWGKHVRYPRSKMSAYQGYMKYVAQPMIDRYVKTLAGSEDPEAIAAAKKQVYATHGVGQISKFIAEMYNRDIKDSVIAPYLNDRNTQVLYQASKQKSNPRYMFNPDDPEEYQNLVKWVSNKKEVKQGIIDKVVIMLEDTGKLTRRQNEFYQIFKDWAGTDADVSDYFAALNEAQSV